MVSGAERFGFKRRKRVAIFAVARVEAFVVQEENHFEC